MLDVANRVGRYELLSELGRGGMATVFLARQTGLDRSVALKRLDALRASNPDLARRFLREARVVGSLNHPNIVTVFEYFEDEGTPYIAMEYVPRGSLRPHVGRLSLAQVGGVLEGVLSGLDHAEEHGIVHRDLKPENLMVSAEGAVKIADFGIAKATRAVRQSASLTAVGTTLGTPQYMAPEQARGQRVGPWTDLYAVGMIAFELLVGHAPFHDTDEPMAVLMRQVNDPVPRVNSKNAEVDPKISDWVARLLVKSADKRPQSASEAWDELEGTLIRLLGSRWRRDAKLGPSAGGAPVGPRTQATPLYDGARTVPPRTQPDDPPPATVAPAGPGRGRFLRRWLGLSAALLITLFAVAMLLRGVGGSGDSKPVASAGQQASVVTPGDWSTVEPVPDVGLPLSDAVALGPGGGDSGPVVVFGVMRGDAAANSSLLPADFVSSLGLPQGELPPRTKVVLAGQELQAWRYANVRPLGSDRELTIYTVPTTRGVAAVVCAVPPTDVAAFAGKCEPIASTLRIGNASPFPVGADDVYATAVNDALGPLQTAVFDHGKQLGESQTPADRSQAAKLLAQDYGRAAKQLGSLPVSPADQATNASIVNALEQARLGYEDVAAAATGGDEQAYQKALAAAAQDEAALDGPLAALQATGYRSSGGPGGSGSSEGAEDGGGAGDSRSDDPSDDAPEHGEA